ncbi:DNA-directed RNA polymerase III subunit RPC4-like [Xenia sp. Carnegie-2017]|uniref:DNA-directed RNA polymerase III subunit RPC4-like n=1 Tax=Xenia sp. Carnegie-2017 TaxID=2897299 RepID=UPI001F035DC4|nr:DNA-directed RNA polymerase III subunit RPC4-like [Xenia sp. Carnegie-2017]
MAEKTPNMKVLSQTEPGLQIKRGGISSRGRLQSFRSPRDLTLGGTSKRTYAPTIPVRRIKEEPKDAPSEQKSRRDPGQTRPQGRGRARGQGRGRGQPNLIQSKSIFSEGLVAKTVSSQPRAPSYGNDVGGGSVSGERSKMTTVKSEKGFEESQKILKMLDEDGVMEVDEKGGVLPMHIPLALHDRFSMEVKDGEEISTVAFEEMDTTDKIPFSKPPGTSQYRATTSQRMTCGELLTSDESWRKQQMLFFQLPDSLSKKMFDDNLKSMKKKNEEKALRLEDIPEGYIGKIRVHKSGRVRFVMDNISLDVSVGTPCNFLQKLVSVRPEKGTMTTLHRIKQRLVCTPDFEDLLTREDT